MAMPEPYLLADKAIKQMAKTATNALVESKRRLLSNGFDELNVIKEIDALYSKLERTFRRKLRELFLDRYLEMLVWLGEKPPKEDTLDELVEMYLAGLLDKPNDVTHYIYDTEFIRKRDRAKEAIQAVPTKLQKQTEMDRHIRYLMQMEAWYADFTSQGAEIQAMKDSGVQRVMRHEVNDLRTCQTCNNADGEIYEIAKIPPLPHLRCRRWFTPA